MSHSLRTRRLAWLGAALLLAATAARAELPRYRVDLIPDPPGGPHYFPLEINDAGTVVGGWFKDRPRGFVYCDGRVLGLDQTYSAAGINRRGDFTGTFLTADSPSRFQPYVYRGDQLVPLELPPGGRQSGLGFDINDAGHVVGVAGDNASRRNRLFLFDGTRTRFLDVPRNYYVQGFLNNQDDVLLNASHDDQGNTGALLYRDGQVTPLPAPRPVAPGQHWSLYGVDLDDSGRALVYFQAGGAVSSWFYADGRYTPVGPEGFAAAGSNERGWAVGSLQPTADTLLRAGLQVGSEFRFLDELVLPRYAGIDYFNASSINDRGQIVGLTGTGMYIATPVPEPGALALMLAGLGAVGAALRRRGPRAGEPT